MNADREPASFILQRLGLTRKPADLRFGWWIVVAVLAIYVVSFALFYPRAAMNQDEAAYIDQTHLIFEGGADVDQIDAFTGEPVSVRPGTYSMGAPMLMAPFFALFGWRGPFALSCVSVVAAVILTGLWIASEKRSPAFALLMMGFPPLLVLGRVAMSDVPSAAIVALGFWLFWRGTRAGPAWWVASGFAAGASWSIRASNPILFVPLFAGAVLRREIKSAALVVGGLAGLAVRLVSHRFFFGEAFFERSSYRFSPETLDDRLPLYLLGLLIFVPGGLFFAMRYRGRRRPEIIVTIAMFFTLYLLQGYSSIGTGFSKRVVLALRYLIPLLPIVAFAMAESVPRLWSAWASRIDSRRRRRAELVGVSAVAIWLGGLGLASAAVHPILAAWGSTQVELHEAVTEFVPRDAVLVTNTHATRKFLQAPGRRFELVDTRQVAAERVGELVRRHDQVILALMDRSDSDLLRDLEVRNEQYLAALPIQRELLADVRPTATDRLRIWRLTARPVDR